MEDLPFDMNGNEPLIIPKEVDLLLAQWLGANDGLWAGRHTHDTHLRAR